MYKAPLSVTRLAKIDFGNRPTRNVQQGNIQVFFKIFNLISKTKDYRKAKIFDVEFRTKQTSKVMLLEIKVAQISKLRLSFTYAFISKIITKTRLMKSTASKNSNLID